MKLKTILTIDALLAALFGVGFVFAPAAIIGIYSMDPSPSAINLGRAVGAMALGFAVVGWSARDARDSRLRKGVVAGLVVAFAVLAANDVVSSLDGTLNSLGWGTVALFAVLVVVNAIAGFTGDTLDGTDIQMDSR